MSIVEKLSGLVDKIRGQKVQAVAATREKYLTTVRRLAKLATPTDDDIAELHAAAEAGGVTAEQIITHLQTLQQYAAEKGIAARYLADLAALNKCKAEIQKHDAETARILEVRKATSGDLESSQQALDRELESSTEARDRVTILEVQEFELLGVSARPMPTYLQDRMRAQQREEALIARNQILHAGKRVG